MTAYQLLEDLQLVDRLKNDDKQAFTEIYRRYAAQLTQFAAAKIHHFEDAGDLIHDLFVKFWEQRKDLQIDRNLKAYLFAVARYRIIDQIRKNYTHQAYAARTTHFDYTGDTIAVLEHPLCIPIAIGSGGNEL